MISLELYSKLRNEGKINRDEYESFLIYSSFSHISIRGNIWFRVSVGWYNNDTSSMDSLVFCIKYDSFFQLDSGFDISHVLW